MEQAEETQVMIRNAMKQLNVENANIAGSVFRCVNGEKTSFENVNLTGMRIADANLSDVEIDGAQLGGAFIHNIGLPPEGHPGYAPGEKQRPLRFENCQLSGSVIADCRLTNVKIDNCDISGLTINGVDIEALLKLHEKQLPERRMETKPVELVDHVQLPAGDIRQAVDWYTQVLGLELLNEMERAAWLKFSEGPVLMLHYSSKDTQVRWSSEEDFPMPAFMFKTRDAGLLNERLERNGAHIRMFKDEGFGWVIKFVDPFGNELGAYEPK